MNNKIAFFLFYLYTQTTAYRCLNFYGLETPSKKLVCSWQNPVDWYLDQAQKLLHIDSIRVPFSQEYVGCSDIKELDQVIDFAANRNISVILDYHRGFSDHQGSSPSEGNITEDIWIDTWLYVLDRYQNKTNIRALSLFNEFQGFDINMTEQMQINLVQVIESLFPGRYTYMLGCIDWGKDCSNMWKTLPVKNAMVEMHTYSFATGKLPSTNVPVFVGEVGIRKNESAPFDIFRRLVKRKGIKDICLWTLAHSHDTDNMFLDDCVTPNNYVIDRFNSLFLDQKPTCLRGPT